MQILHVLLCSLLCACGFIMSLSKNPIEAVLFLILSFCLAAGISFIFHAEFLGLILILVYVGAIAVLFLFVIMMLNIKNQESESKLSYLSKPLIFLFCVSIFMYYFDISLTKILFYNSESTRLYEHVTSSLLLVDDLTNIDVMGQWLFNYYLICFLIAGIILLIALIGAIVLTLRFNNKETSELVNKQLARTDNNLSFFKTKK